MAGYSKNKIVAIIVTVALLLMGGIGGSVAASSAGNAVVDVANEAIEAPAVPAAPAPAAPEVKAPAAPEPVAEAQWVEVVSLGGSADQASQVFELTGKETRMVYEFIGSDPDMAIAAVYVEKEGADIMVDGGMPVVMISKPEGNTTALHKKAGMYFVDVKAANLDSWTVKIEEKK